MSIRGTGRWCGFVVVLVLGSILTAPVSAADWYVSTVGDNGNSGSVSAPWRTITYAVEENASVRDGDTIHIAAGTYEEWDIALDKNLTLSGEGAGSTIVDGMEMSSYSGGVLSAYYVTVSLEDLTIQHGSAACLGGGVSAYGSTLTITDCRITNNTAGAYGGGIYLYQGTLTIDGSTITGNTAENVWSELEGIVAATGGGGISAYNATVAITGATIGGNHALEGNRPWMGGGISQRKGTLTMAGSTLSGNTAGRGGGVHLGGVAAEITGCTIEENWAYFTFDDEFTGGGAGMFLQGGSLALVDSTLRDNFANQYGGGIHAADGAVLISESVIADNYVDKNHGGGVSQVGGTLAIQGGTIGNNNARVSGGGVRCTNVNPLTLSGTLVAENSAMNGGGVYQEDGTAVITDTVLLGNNATISGGGVCQDSGTMSISGSTLDRNIAGWYGGGVFQKEDGTLTITGTTIIENTADYGGWGVHTNGTVAVYNCNLRNTYNFYRENGAATLTTTVTKAANIVGGPFIGGNYWGSPAGDGFGDIPYTVAGATDPYPLTTPIAAFTADPASGTAPLTVRFTSTAVGTVTSLTWDFGDGDTATTHASSVDHTYSSAGTYTVSLTVTDGTGSSTASRSITVRGAPSSSPDDGGPSDTAVAAATGLAPGENVTLNLDPSKSAFYSINVTVNDTVKEILVTARDTASPGSGIPLPNGTIFQFIEVILYKTTDDLIERAELRFAVPLAWLEEEGVIPADIVLYRWHDGAWQELPTMFVKEEDGKAYFTATSPGFSLFAIAAVEQVVVSEEATPVPTDEPTVEATVSEEPGEPVPAETAAPTPEPTQSPLLWAPLLALAGLLLLLWRR